jgi:nucleoid-associated protein YgaU
LLLVIGVLAVGVAAAWPFRHKTPPAALSAAPPTSDLPPPVREITLQVSPLADVSPAVGLEPPPPPITAHAAPRKPLRLETSDQPLAPTLETLGSPPQMPEMYQSLLRTSADPTPTMTTSAAQPSWTNRPAYARRRPKEHRIVDGDTLPALAERYLGDAAQVDELYELNRDILPSRDLLPVGKRLRIPRSDSSLTPVESTGALEQTPVSIAAPAAATPLRLPD